MAPKEAVHLAGHAAFASYRNLRPHEFSSSAAVINRDYQLELCGGSWPQFALKLDLPARPDGTDLRKMLLGARSRPLLSLLRLSLENSLEQHLTCVMRSGRIQTLLELVIMPVAEGVLLSRVVEIERVIPADIDLHQLYRHTDELLHCCRRCERFLAPQTEEWHWVPQLSKTRPTSRLRLLCPSCEKHS
jgi:hypothetical protein